MNFIFDVDGTLIDSYDGINESVIEVLNNNGFKYSNTYIKKYILDFSVYDLFKKIENDNVSFDKLNNDFIKSRLNTQSNYSFMPYAKEVIKRLYDMGHKLFIYTHKSDYIEIIINDNDLNKYFTEIIHAKSKCFKRKPNSDSINYLVEKYKLNKNDTYYVGDRKIDIVCANNSNIKYIFYNEKDIDINYTYRINNLYDILKICNN